MKPSLFGLNNSNRDFSSADSWGKNQFNSSFPASLVCYMASKNIELNYISIENGKFGINTISASELLTLPFDDKNLYFSFETQYTPFQKFVIGNLPRTDLVIMNSKTGECVRNLEVKLTALPDNTTCNLKENEYGSEIVIRPDTIVYLAASLSSSSLDSISNLSKKNPISIDDWSEPKNVLPFVPKINKFLEQLAKNIKKQQPILLQPIWKTEGKSPRLSENCLDVFVWSDTAFTYFISQIANDKKSISRHGRTSVWLYKMLQEIVENGKFNHQEIIDKLSFNTKNDKAFASSGNITNKFMTCDNLSKPRILKSEIKNIILGGGQNLLSPERRFDAIIFNSPELFL
ncbi:MAG: HindVP family restriction endonuclease [Spirochaetaceae bacterium]|nr:HindVP family restriction endonuclease [Spirochaetaceae bacterium]